MSSTVPRIIVRDSPILFSMLHFAFESLLRASSFFHRLIPPQTKKGTTTKKKIAEKELQHVFFSPFGQTVVQTLIRMVDVRGFVICDCDLFGGRSRTSAHRKTQEISASRKL